LEIPPTYLEDASGLKGSADAVIVPATHEEVAAALREAVAKRIPITIAGAGTGVTGGKVPAGGWVISLEKLTRLEVAAGRAVAGAGVLLRDLHAAAQASGQLYPPDPTEWSASVGGTIATNASGSRSFRYGSTRAWVETLTIALMSGEVRRFTRGDKADFDFRALRAPHARKCTSGYYLREGMDWVDLFIGSEGTLGVVLEAEVRLVAAPGERLSGVVFFESEDAALQVVNEWRIINQLNMLEFLDCASLEVLRERYRDLPVGAQAALMIEQDLDGLGGDAVDLWVERLERAGGMEESWFGETPADRERFRVFRHALPEIVNDRVRQNGFQKMSSDFAVPLDRNAEMMAFYRRRLGEEFAGKHVVFGHIGDAHVHFNLMPESPEDVERGRALMVEMACEAVRLGGTVSAEHGLGKRKCHLLEIEWSAEEIERMKSVKRALDPHWLLGRGTLFRLTE
jgi:FAD/FMN-containing dehydrogenase